ncbi:MAG: YdeI/OmpD-associated family protein [Bacteroidota bacterium]|nr:YdeI/OmpD-associated family protein [Bacteroidota bacterium]MDP4218411.1 YdeI/OmpD-associated family protein [Bacteroidota bacterium]MDP4246524.1 YdeI/OmpD-associated family protein [Bacteroidota bacterium]MDP4256467.1 YdeI/OmpD-associated family protein [Bacteroidota bacterium]MDP4260756.1 YdeI/OmpD-associated family protein [Bacteroidota bacterium]
MIRFNTTILQFGEQGEKTGWSYIRISAAHAAKLMPGNKKSFRVKGRLDDLPISKMALIPMGGGEFIMALNAAIRKSIGKGKGARLSVQIEVDKVPLKPPKDLMECLADEPTALAFFNSLTPGHRNYFGKWVDAAKTDATRARRIAQAVTAMARSMDFGQMLRSLKQDRQDLMG